MVDFHYKLVYEWMHKGKYGARHTVFGEERSLEDVADSFLEGLHPSDYGEYLVELKLYDSTDKLVHDYLAPKDPTP